MANPETKSKEKVKSGATVAPCSCRNAGQDAIHGEHRRVHNYTKDGKLRCTGCGTTKG